MLIMPIIVIFHILQISFPILVQLPHFNYEFIQEDFKFLYLFKSTDFSKILFPPVFIHIFHQRLIPLLEVNLRLII